MVSTSTRGAAGRPAPIRRVASMPSMRGMRTSISTTSGSQLAGELDRLGAVARLADDLDVRPARGSAGSPCATSSWSSASRTRIVGPCSGSLARTANPPSGRGSGVQLAAVAARTRSRMPTRPWPPPGACGRARAPGRGRATASSSASVAPVERDRGGRAARVLAHVGQRLLDDPVGGEVDARRQRAAARRSTSSSTGSPPRAARSSSPASCASPGCGASSPPSSSLAQHAEQLAHLGQRLAGRARIASSGARASARVAVERGLGGVGLDRDHADAVGDDVVQLARDPAALLGDRGARAALALALEMQRQLSSRALLLAQAAHDAAGDRRRRDRRAARRRARRTTSSADGGGGSPATPRGRTRSRRSRAAGPARGRRASRRAGTRRHSRRKT